MLLPPKVSVRKNKTQVEIFQLLYAQLKILLGSSLPSYLLL
jgi:hypothetical protein